MSQQIKHDKFRDTIFYRQQRLSVQLINEIFETINVHSLILISNRWAENIQEKSIKRSEYMMEAANGQTSGKVQLIIYTDAQ